MNRKPNRGGGRRRPPNDRLIGRTEVARLLGCDLGTVRRLGERELLKPALVEADGVRWFDLEAMQLLAAQMKVLLAAKMKKRRARPAPRGEAGGRRPPLPPLDDYYPENRTRRSSQATAATATPKPPAKGRAAPQAETQNPRTNLKPAALRGLGPLTEIRSEWWDADLTPLAPPPSPSPTTSGTTVIDPAWFDRDFKCED